MKAKTKLIFTVSMTKNEIEQHRSLLQRVATNENHTFPREEENFANELLQIYNKFITVKPFESK